MLQASASCPASLSFIFKVCPNKDPIKMGSIGIGCTIDKEVIVTVERSPLVEITFNGKAIDFPTVQTVVKKLATVPLKVYIKSSLPLGYGFGVSGASALSCAFAVDRLFNLGKTREELINIAHTSEITNQTGLGSVGTQITGGFLVKRKPGLPVNCIKLSLIGEKLYAIIIDKMLTSAVLNNQEKIKKVNAIADYYIGQCLSNNSLQLKDVINLSYDFVNMSGLLTDKILISIIDRIRKVGGSATMTILGKVVITNLKPTFIKDYKFVELTITKCHI